MRDRRTSRRAGFTIVEIVVVIGILSLMATSLVALVEHVQDNVAVDIARSEMTAIKRAIVRFRRDTGATLPQPSGPADFSGLFTQPVGPGWSAWDPDRNRGWRGPYLTLDTNCYTAIADAGSRGLQPDGAGSPATGAVEYPQAVADPFAQPSPPTYPWSRAPNGPRAADRGSPYLLFDLADPDKARIVSMGANGEYESSGNPDGGGDDLVLYIFR